MTGVVVAGAEAVAASGQVSAWTFHAHPEVWLILGAAVAGFWYLVRRVGPGAVEPGEPVITAKQTWLFMASVLLLWAFSDYPIPDLARAFLFSGPMAQPLGFRLVVPPMVVVPTPQGVQGLLLRA